MASSIRHLLLLKIDIHERGESCILRCWKALLMHFQFFQFSKHKHYPFQVITDVNATTSPRVAHQHTWNHGVNMRGGKGNNIPLDLHMEHLNRAVKDLVANLCANVQCAQSQKVLTKTCRNFDDELDIRPSLTIATPR